MTLIHKRSIEKEDDKIIIIETGIIDQKLINEYINTDEDFGK